MIYTFPPNYGTDSILVEVDAALVPLVAGALRPFEQRYSWATDIDYEQGYNAFCKLQVEFMGAGIARLQMEIRAMRGVDELDPGYNDPTVDPFSLRMGHIEKVAVQLEGVNAKLQTIIDNMAQQQTPAELAEIVQELGTIAALLA